MSKKTDKEEVAEKKADGAKAGRKAARAKQKKEDKRAADKLTLDMAANLPVGQAKTFLQIDADIDGLEAQRRQINLAIRGKRGDLKEMKIDLRSYDHVRKLKKMDVEDRKSFKATVALYEDQLKMPLSEQQRAEVDTLNKQREEARSAMGATTGTDTGKEVGSGKQEASAPAAAPVRNEAISAQFRAPVAPVSTH